MPSHMIIRHGAPTKYDHAPFGTSCKAINATGDSFELYIQYGNDEQNPRWEYMGTFNGDPINSHLCNNLSDSLSVKKSIE